MKGSQKKSRTGRMCVRTANRFNKKTARTAIARLREITDQKDAATFLKKVTSFIDKLAKKEYLAQKQSRQS
jgi:ribosomal protein S20